MLGKDSNEIWQNFALNFSSSVEPEAQNSLYEGKLGGFNNDN